MHKLGLDHSPFGDTKKSCVVLTRSFNLGGEWSYNYELQSNECFLGFAFSPSALRAEPDYVESGKEFTALLGDREDSLDAKVGFLGRIIRRERGHRVVIQAELAHLRRWSSALKTVFGKELEVIQLCEETITASTIRRSCLEWMELAHGDNSTARDLDSIVSQTWTALLTEREDWDRLFLQSQLRVRLMTPPFAPSQYGHAKNEVAHELPEPLRIRATTALTALLLGGQRGIWRGIPSPVAALPS